MFMFIHMWMYCVISLIECNIVVGWMDIVCNAQFTPLKWKDSEETDLIPVVEAKIRCADLRFLYSKLSDTTNEVKDLYNFVKKA